jgi:hypothetical protein
LLQLPEFEDFQSVQDGSAAHFGESARPANSVGLAQSAHSAHSESGALEKNTQNLPERPIYNAVILNPDGTDSSFRSGAVQPTHSQGQSGNGTEPLTPGNGTEPPQPAAGQVQPGADPAPVNPGSIAAMIRLMAAAHPDWSPERLAKASGQPVSIVKRTLARKPRNDLAGGIH